MRWRIGSRAGAADHVDPKSIDIAPVVHKVEVEDGVKCEHERYVRVGDSPLGELEDYVVGVAVLRRSTCGFVGGTPVGRMYV